MIDAKMIALVVGAVVLAMSPALGRDRLHHHHRRAAVAHGYAQPYAGYGGSYADTQDDAVARATARAYTEPGVTQELAPDAKQSATGGPSGGVPGFSGGM